MNLEAQRIAIAEACGWTSGVDDFTFDPKGKVCAGFPDYLKNLNAIHEAEKLILAGGPFGPNMKLRRKWRFELWQVVSRYAPDFDEEDMIHASAAERAEAFLRALGKWKEA